VTFIWMQGERDAKEGLGEGYAPKLRMLIDQLKADLKRKDIAFVIGRISDHGMKDDMKIPGWPGVREAQVQVAEADPLGAWTDTDDLNGDDDGLHYNAAGYAKLGERFAEQAIMLVKKRAAATKP
jgi:lysophospholipase L1-like esterase